MLQQPSRVHPKLLVALYVLCAAISVLALYDTGARYNGFQIEQGGVHFLMSSEVVFYFWYGLWGTCASVFLALALGQTRVPERMLESFDAMCARPRLWVALAALFVPLAALAFRAFVLLDQAIADDEGTYLFQAQTLLQGRLINPLPAYPTFYRNQFIVIGERGWYGQYPIGHPLLLALGELVHARWLVVPLLGACSVWLTFAIGKKLFDVKRAAIAACWLVLSPQFVWTHGTLLSQAGSLSFTLLGIWSLLQLQDNPRQLRWAVLTGLAWGFGILIRPMPVALFLAVAVASHVASYLHHSQAGAPRWKWLFLQLMAAGPGAALGFAAIAVTNYVESGSPLVSAYKTIHGGYGALPSGFGFVSNSFGGALVRQNFWLFGWTLSLIFVPFMRPRRGALLVWGMIAADYAYRLIVPKTVVSTTGPVYVFEAVPLLVLGSVDGAIAVARALSNLGLTRARAWVMAAAIASSLVALVTFVPIEGYTAYVGSGARLRVFDLIAQAGATEPVLIFSNHVVAPDRTVTWAYFPPNPSPTLDDRVLFLRLPDGRGGPRRSYELWIRQFPERRAFLYTDTLRGQQFAELKVGQPPPDTATLEDLLTHDDERSRSERP